MSSLDDLRRRINELDRQILELVGKRQEASLEVARAKRATGQATRDYNREREVLLAAREAGRQYGVSPQLAENILRLLIRSSLTTQEQASVAAVADHELDLAVRVLGPAADHAELEQEVLDVSGELLAPR